MPTSVQSLTTDEAKRFKASPVKCPLLKQRTTNLADFLAIVSDAIRTDDVFWFRGHEDVRFSLIPSALRFSALGNRQKALALMADFKRIADSKMPRPPRQEEELLWALIAQHYGLPTRLLDWTESATTALYFACLKDDRDGMVFILNPVQLNTKSYPGKPRVLDPHEDADIILAYLRMGAKPAKNGRMPVAINPVWNSDRLIMQKGVFTLHGRKFDLNKDTPTLAAIPILRESKKRLRAELQRIGVDELTLFPELEHACAHLKRRAGLENCK